MATAPKSGTRKAKGGENVARVGFRPRGVPSPEVAGSDVSGGEAPPAAAPQNAEASLLRDIDAILSRLDDGIARERKAMDDLLQRIRRPAA